MLSRLGAAALLLFMLPLGELAAQTVIEADGAAELGVALRRLGTTSRVLMIAAHPDDENTALIAQLALSDGADVAYLSLTRGEGGQNLIGPELQEGLGLIRTEELLAARRLDGARQFFTRAYDYGFSKSADEAFTQWPRDSLLADVVEVVRRYRPDVIVSVFSGTAADGHGQHQAAGIMAREAFSAAADPARFPMQAARGLEPHAARYLFQALYRPPPDPPLRIATGDYDALFGRSRYQIAMQSRSRHRSQDMGMAEPLGPQFTALRVLGGDFPEHGASLFAGIDTTLSRHALASAAPDTVVRALESYERSIARLRSSFNPLRTGTVNDALVDAVRALDQAALLLSDTDRTELLRLVRIEREQAAAALLLDAGVLIDIVADTPAPVPGTSFSLTATIWNGGTDDIEIASLSPAVPDGWSYDAGEAAAPSILKTGAVVRRTFRIDVPASATPTRPYFLRTERTGAMYSWADAPDSVRALPFQPAPVGADIVIRRGVDIPLHRDAVSVDVDKAFGEVRRPLIVVPAASVAVEPRIAAIAAGDVGPREVSVTATAARDGMSGVLRLTAPAGWVVSPAAVDIALARAGDSHTEHFAITPPANAGGEYVLNAAFEADGRTFDEALTLIDYPHINPRALYQPATVRASVFPVHIAQNLRVGYIEGAGDDGAEALLQLGASVEQLDASALANGDLSQYNAIVAGIRAYEVRPDLIANNARLLEYTRRGGTFIVQYNKYEIVDGGFMPFAATMARPHGRVTDESADVELIAPAHPVLASPNRITADDFEGWVQERGLYFLDTFDSRYEPLLSMADPGEAAQLGSLLVARVGEGWYVYTGLALFRQLPQAVPGAFRLLANLVSLGT